VGLAISRGGLHLSAASLIAPHLSAETVDEWLKAARHKTTREINRLIAGRSPREAVRSSIRRVSSRSRNADRLFRIDSAPSVLQPVGLPPSSSPQPSPTEAQRPAFTACSTSPATSRASTSSASSAPAVSSATSASSAAVDLRETGTTEALGAERYVVRFTADERVHAELQELRSLLRHSVPDGDVGKILARAICALLEQVRKRKIGACGSPRSAGGPKRLSSEGRSSGDSTAQSSGGPAVQPLEAKPCSLQAKKPAKRNIPVSIRREVWTRDDGRCTYQSREGRCCGSRETIEFHHRIPWARCKDHTVENIALRCRAHNQYEVELDFGAEHMAQFRKEVEVR